jgi:hypothetical protein
MSSEHTSELIDWFYRGEDFHQRTCPRCNAGHPDLVDLALLREIHVKNIQLLRRIDKVEKREKE